MNTFAVYYIPAHGDTVGGIFLLLSAIYFVSFLEKKSKLFYCLSLVFFVGGLLCHEYNIIFPFHLILISYFGNREHFKTKQRAASLLPFILASIIFLGCRLYFTKFGSIVLERNDLVWLTGKGYIASIAHLVFWYIKNLVTAGYAPIIWNISPSANNTWAWSIGFIFISTLLLFLAFIYWRKNFKLAFLLWLLIGFFPIPLAMFAIPALGLVIEPHWLLFSSIGFFALVATFLKDFYGRFGKLASIILFTIIILGLFLKTNNFKHYWKDDLTYSKFC